MCLRVEAQGCARVFLISLHFIYGGKAFTESRAHPFQQVYLASLPWGSMCASQVLGVQSAITSAKLLQGPRSGTQALVFTPQALYLPQPLSAVIFKRISFSKHFSHCEL